jgi:sterol 14-demethylase
MNANRQPPLVSGGLPLIGHGLRFVRGTIPLLFRAFEEHGEVAALRVGPRRMVVLLGPKAHEAVFRASDRQLSAREAYSFMTPVFGRGIAYDAEPERMDQQLKMLLGALKDRRMRSYSSAILDEVERSTASFGDQGEFDVVDYFRRLTMYTSTRCLIGHEFRERMTDEFGVLYGALERSITPLAFLNARLPIPTFRRRDEARARLAQMIAAIVRERRSAGTEGEDFLQTLMEAHYADGTANTDDEITGLLLAAIFAGHHTSSVTAAWTLLELLQNPAYLARVLAELARVHQDGAPITYASLREIDATENAVKEALRLHPPIVLLVRVVEQDFVFREWILPRGTWVLLSPLVAHRMNDVFPDAERFDPDRFAPPRNEDKRDFAFIPFGGGPHKCLGSAFALLQVKAIFAALFARFDFELVGDPIRADFHGTVVGPVSPVRVRYKRKRSLSRVEPMQAAGKGLVDKRRRLVVDRDLCQGHAVCVSEAPDVFCLAGDGKVSLLLESPPESAMDRVRAAERHCPTGAIRARDVGEGSDAN